MPIELFLPFSATSQRYGKSMWIHSLCVVFPPVHAGWWYRNWRHTYLLGIHDCLPLPVLIILLLWWTHPVSPGLWASILYTLLALRTLKWGLLTPSQWLCMSSGVRMDSINPLQGLRAMEYLELVSTQSWNSQVQNVTCQGMTSLLKSYKYMQAKRNRNNLWRILKGPKYHYVIFK